MINTEIVNSLLLEVFRVTLRINYKVLSSCVLGKTSIIQTLSSVKTQERERD